MPIFYFKIDLMFALPLYKKLFLLYESFRNIWIIKNGIIKVALVENYKMKWFFLHLFEKSLRRYFNLNLFRVQNKKVKNKYYFEDLQLYDESSWP